MFLVWFDKLTMTRLEVILSLSKDVRKGLFAMVR
jgi:hypothetical protein